MIRKYGTINEEVNRIKSLFGESRLYGNLVEQDEQSDDVCEWFKPNQVEALDILKEVLILAKAKKMSLIFEPEEQKKIGVLIEMLEVNIKTIEDINCEGGIVIVCSTENTTKIDGGIELLNSKLEGWPDGENEGVKTKLERLVEILNEIKSRCADAVGDHNDDNTEVVGKSDEELMKDIGDSPGGNLNNELGVFDFNEWQISYYKHFVSEEWKHTVERWNREDGYVIEDISNYTKEEKEYLKQCFLIENRQNEEGIVKINNVFNPEESEKTVTTNSSTGGADEKSGTEEEIVTQTDTDTEDGSEITTLDIDSKTAIIKGYLENEPKNGEYDTFEGSDSILVYKIKSDDNTEIKKGDNTENKGDPELGDKPKMKEGYSTEEDIIYISEKEGNREFKLGKMEYDKDKEVFKIISKYPFYSKKTDYLVKRTEESFWNTLSKWYTKELNSDNTTLDIKNGKKFKVIIK